MKPRSGLHGVCICRFRDLGKCGRGALNDTAYWAFTQLIARAQLLGATEPDHYLFPGFSHRHTQEEGVKAKGAGYDPTKPQVSWRTGWRSLTTRAGLPGLRFHDMRHHACTKMTEDAEASEQTLLSISGHVSREMLEHYSHARTSARRKAVEALNIDVITAKIRAAAETKGV